jgi:hypothetical protein
VERLFFRAYGRSVAISAPADALSLVGQRVPPSYRVTRAEPERTWTLRPVAGGWTTIGSTLGQLSSGDLVGATELLLSDLELWVAEHARRRVFVHAGCVVASGQAIVLPSPTLGGKSSLTAALIRGGATYYSDEFAVLDANGRVYPYARSLSIRPYEGGTTVRRDAAAYGAPTGRGAVRIGLIAALRYEPQRGWDVRALSSGETVMVLLENTVPARSRPRASLAAAVAAASHAAALAGTRGDADDAADVLLTMLSACSTPGSAR